jgi:hypothetical protein
MSDTTPIGADLVEHTLAIQEDIKILCAIAIRARSLADRATHGLEPPDEALRALSRHCHGLEQRCEALDAAHDRAVEKATRVALELRALRVEAGSRSGWGGDGLRRFILKVQSLTALLGRSSGLAHRD